MNQIIPKVISDSSEEFRLLEDMLHSKVNLGFGMRPCKYVDYINNIIIEKMWIEQGIRENTIVDSYGQSSTKSLVEYFETL